MKGEDKLREVMKAQCIHDDDRVELQDIIGRCTTKELMEFEDGLDASDRRMFLWVVFVVMGADNAMDVFEKTIATNHVRCMVERAEDRMSHRLRKLEDRERIFSESERAVHRRLRVMRLERVRAEGRADALSRRLAEVMKRLDNRYEQIEQLKESVEELEDELEEYRIVKQAFEILAR